MNPIRIEAFINLAGKENIDDVVRDVNKWLKKHHDEIDIIQMIPTLNQSQYCVTIMYRLKDTA